MYRLSKWWQKSDDSDHCVTTETLTKFTVEANFLNIFLNSVWDVVMHLKHIYIFSALVGGKAN